MLRKPNAIIDNAISTISEARRGFFSCQANNIFNAGLDSLRWMKAELDEDAFDEEAFISEYNNLIVGIITASIFTQKYSTSNVTQFVNLEGENAFLKISEEYNIDPYTFTPPIYFQATNHKIMEFFNAIGKAVLESKKIPEYSLDFEYLKLGIDIKQLTISRLMYQAEKMINEYSEKLFNFFSTNSKPVLRVREEENGEEINYKKIKNH